MKKRVLMLCLCLLLLTSCAATDTSGFQATPTSVQPGSDLPSPTSAPLADLLQTEQLLLTTPPQAGNPAQLAQRLKHTRVGAIRRAPASRQVGQEESFWIDEQDSATYRQIRARLAFITPHAYLYVEDGQQFNQTALQLSAEAFEQKIYPEDRALSGSAWTAGVDGDTHITILNAAGLGQSVGGLFSPQDEYSTSISPHSNQRDMLYMNLDGEIPGSADYNATLANEFQQLLNWRAHPLTLDWLNEGLAILAQHLNGYSANGADQIFLKTPDVQLNDWPTDPTLEAAHAGAAYLFLDYFAEHYGGQAALKDLLQDPAPPPANFDDVLARRGYSDHFIDVWRKWLVANFVANPKIDAGEYGYPSIHLSALTPQQVITSYPSSQSGQLAQYAADYYDLPAHAGKGGTLSIQLRGAPTVRLVGNDPLDASGEWWGNRADNMDSTLTRSFDLTSLRGQSVALQFATWFDLEQGHDYAYVEVSTDNGATWNTLKGNVTSSDNPNGLNWGNGYTGVSGGGSAPAWVQEKMDLTPYAGKRIQLRFEEVTDNAHILQGFAVDQIRIPALSFQDDASSSDGWTSQGFVYTSNVLPEHYLAQAIIYTGSSFTVRSINADLASAQGALSIPDFGGRVTRVVLIVAAYALDTTLQAHYQLDIHVS